MSIKNLGIAVLFSTIAAGCSFKSARIPSAAIPFAEADYQVMGKTKAETCSSYILGIDWGHLFSNQAATIPVAAGGFSLPFVGGGNSEERRAMYMALEKMPKATHLLDPRFEGSVKGLVLGRPIFGERCATVHAHGVRIEEKPFSRLND